MVASVTTMAATHFGSKVADELAPTFSEGSTLDGLATAGLKLISWLTGNKTTDQTNLQAALSSLSTAGSAAFNAKFPVGAPTTPCGEGPEVASVAGHSIRWYSASGTAVKTNGWDISDLILAGTAPYFGSEENDGLVSRCSSRWGKVLKDNYAWNHLDEVNQVLGIIGKNAPSPVAFYQQQANRLKLAGL
jgi:triacylglycerol lipase